MLIQSQLCWSFLTYVLYNERVTCTYNGRMGGYVDIINLAVNNVRNFVMQNIDKCSWFAKDRRGCRIGKCC